MIVKDTDIYMTKMKSLINIKVILVRAILDLWDLSLNDRNFNLNVHPKYSNEIVRSVSVLFSNTTSKFHCDKYNALITVLSIILS